MDVETPTSIRHDDGEDPPPDFLAYLEYHLGVDRDTALSTLSAWLASYEPVQRRPIEILSGPPPEPPVTPWQAEVEAPPRTLVRSRRPSRIDVVEEARVAGRA